MHVHKPEDALLLLGHASLAGRPVLNVTVGYVCEVDGSRVTETDAWQWLIALFPDEPFDLGEKKSRRGFGVAGDACAPGGTQVDGLTVRAGVGDLEARVLVLGDRHWTQTLAGWRASAPRPFERMPIGLARSFGGPDWADNPFGRGHVAGAAYEGVVLPNVEHPEHPVLNPDDTPPLATLGALPLCSTDRRRWLGTLDDAWIRKRLPWLPDDTDPRWFDRFAPGQCGPGYWRGDEHWFAENMHPHQARVEGRLPGLRPRLLMRTVDAPERHAELPLDLDTVWLMPNDRRVVVLYRAQTPVRREDAKDILGLAVFTETQSESPRALAHWSEQWRKALDRETDVTPAAAAPAALSAEELARIETLRMQAEEFEAELKADIEGSLQEAEEEAYERMRAAGFDVEALKAHAAAHPAEIPEDIFKSTPLGEMPADPEAFKAKLKAHIDNELARGENEARQLMEKLGMDYDTLREHAERNAPAELDEVGVLSEMLELTGLPEDERQARVDEYAEFMKEMDGLEARLQAQFEEGRQAAAAAAALPAGRLRDSDELPSGPRTPLTREALLERAQRGESAVWTQLQGLDLAGVSLAGLSLRGSIVRDCNLNGADLQGTDLTEAQLENCQLGGADLTGACLDRAQLQNCVFDEARLERAQFSAARLTSCSFDRSTLHRSSWDDAQVDACAFEAALMHAAHGKRARFAQCRMPGVDATQSEFEQTSFEQCQLDGVCFSRAQLARTTFITCQAAHAQFDHARLEGLRTLQETSLEHANLNGADLQGASLQKTSLANATLREARLDQALVKECDLKGTDAWRMVAREADFTDSQIAAASWRGANLMKATLGYAKVFDTDLTGSNLHAVQTRTATVQGLKLEGALMTRCRLIQEYGDA